MSRTGVIIVVPNGLNGKGGIERLMLYLTREIHKMDPSLNIGVHPTRLTEVRIVNHFSSLVSLIWFTWRCAFGGYRLAHINIAPRGSTWRKFAFLSVARAFNMKVILHLHGSGYNVFYESSSMRQRRFIQYIFSKADKIVVLGSYWRNFARSVLNISDDRVVIINNGAPDSPSRSSPERTPPTICFAGLVGERKGVDVLLKALSSVQSKEPWSMIIGGNGEVERFSLFRDDLHLQDRVTFTGWLDEAAVEKLLCESQIFVLPSRAENQPMSIIEAMAHGLPVVSTRIGAIPEQVDDGVSGLVVTPGNVTELATALTLLISDPALRREMGDQGRIRYEKSYSIQSNADKFLVLYRSL